MSEKSLYQSRFDKGDCIYCGGIKEILPVPLTGAQKEVLKAVALKHGIDIKFEGEFQDKVFSTHLN